MSERMIELQRAKMGLAPAGVSPAVPVLGSSQLQRMGTPIQQSPAVAQLTPQQAAAAEMLSEDALMQRFIHRLQRRDDSHPTADSSNGPTVPTALSRRMLHRQGVGYLDDTVAAAISASADRFLATVLQQSVACRDQRLKGAEMAREAARHRKRHMQHYAADTDNRKRRKEEIDQAHEKVHLNAISAAEALRKGGGSKDADDKKKKKKKKVVPTEDGSKSTNGVKLDALKNLDDDEESYDSLDEEEEYYQACTTEVRGRINGGDDEEDDTLLLRDLARPLQAWDFCLTGKEALEPREPESDEEDGDLEMEENGESVAQPTEENGNEDGLLWVGMDGAKSDGKSADDGDNEAKRKGTSSPLPNAS